MNIALYNTMSRTIEPFTPQDGNVVRIYTCGLTVYNQPHIGNWIGYIYWDTLIRLLQSNNYTVERTQNITDVGHLVSDDDDGEDKMEKVARQEGATAWDVAKKYSGIAEHEAYELLGLLRPDHLVPATSCIDKQIAFAQQLDEKGFLYRTEDGMYFDTSKLDEYGKLAQLDIAGLEAGARVQMAGKKHPTDFAVWKFSPKDQRRDMEWESPWGIGFPGWHLECSVIARETLGDTIDIHTGGIDHIPVHHTNEIAQTESLTGKRFAHYWLHINHMKVNGSKMSKSLGNVYTLADIVEHGYDIMAFKLFTLGKQYQTEGNFTWENLDAAQHRLWSWRDYAALRHQTHDRLRDDTKKDNDDGSITLVAAIGALKESLSNNLNTPQALSVIDHAFTHLDNRSLEKVHRSGLVELLESIDSLLGLDLLSSTPDISDDAKQIILERSRARSRKDWEASDRLRDNLSAQGIVVRDTPTGVVWSYSHP